MGGGGVAIFQFAGERTIGYNPVDEDCDEDEPANCRIVGVDAHQYVLHAKLEGCEFRRTLCGKLAFGKPTSIPVKLYGHCELRWCHKCAKELIEHKHRLPIWEDRLMARNPRNGHVRPTSSERSD